MQDVYNGFGQLITQYQEHSGSVNTSTSLKVQYGYSIAANDSRLSSETYPNGRVEDYVYNSGIDTNISRATVGTTKDKKALCTFGVAIRDLPHLSKIIRALEGVEGVISVARVQKSES